MKEYYLCNLHNEVFGRVETRINTKCFLSVREGVSRSFLSVEAADKFPLCTGGCISNFECKGQCHSVSSLYGRVYHVAISTQNMPSSFLPVREGISRHKKTGLATRSFPPCTGGCIMTERKWSLAACVSSLYGRVYPCHVACDINRKQKKGDKNV